MSSASTTPPPGSPVAIVRSQAGKVRLILGVAIALVAGSGITAIAMKRHEPKDISPPAFVVEGDVIRTEAGKSPLVFETTAAQLGEPLPSPPVTGRVTTVETLTSPSFAPLSGRVVETRVRIGAHVKQGEKLIEVRTADLAAMQREFRAAQLAVRTKQALADRLGQLVESRAASRNDLMVAESELDDAKFAVQAADARLRSLAVDQDGDTQYWVLAVRSGIVVQLDASPGKQVGPESEKPVATVADLREVLIVADVPQKEAILLSAGQTATIRLPGTAEVLTDEIESVSDIVDSERQTVPIRIRANNERLLLRPNAYVDVVFSRDGKGKTILVPSSAVVSDGNTAVVFVEQEPGKLRRRSVQIGHQTKEQIEVSSGLEAGEKVVSRGALLLLNAIHIQG